MTLMETLLASSIATMALAVIVSLLLTAAKEQRRGLSDSSLQQEISVVQDRVIGLLRSMSASESAVFGDPITLEGGLVAYQRVIVARGAAPEFPREEIFFQPATRRLFHDPDRSVSGDEVKLAGEGSIASLHQVYFYPGLKPGGAPDSAVMNIWMEFDDEGYSGRRNGDGSLKNTSVIRTYAVRMRGE